MTKSARTSRTWPGAPGSVRPAAPAELERPEVRDQWGEAYWVLTYKTKVDKRIDLGYEGPDDMPPELHPMGNPVLLQEMVRNLVDNAIAYSGRGGVVTARVLADRFSGVQVLQVEDDGPGVPENERHLVMQPFYRALGTNVDGSGLGLAIVQEIAQQHGATVQMEDAHPERAQRGLRVTVKFVPKPDEAQAGL